MDSIFGENGLFNNPKFKFLRYLIILLLVGVFLMLLGDIGNDLVKPNKKTSVTKSTNNQLRKSLSLEEVIEDRMTKVLSQIEGVGKVMVDLSLDKGTEYTYARDRQDSQKETVEEDDSGGRRKTVEYTNKSEIVVLNSNGEDVPLIKKEVKPKIRGVLVVAEGANNSYVKDSLFRAIKIGLGVPSHKIVILAKGG